MRKKGFAVRLHKKRVTASAVHNAIDRLLHNEKAREKVKEFQNELQKWNDPENAAKFLYETFGE